MIISDDCQSFIDTITKKFFCFTIFTISSFSSAMVVLLEPNYHKELNPHRQDLTCNLSNFKCNSDVVELFYT